ncbi:MAG: M48 family metallopeptidase [Methanobacteriota archaeon]
MIREKQLKKGTHSIDEMNQQEIRIIRSKRRKRTIQARQENGVFWIYLPSGMSSVEEKKWIDRMITVTERRKRRKELSTDNELEKRAQELNNLFFNGTLDFHIKYVTNQNTRFGSCTSATKTIRISDRIAKMPRWVQDYVIIHELAHLRYPNHSKSFWEKVNEYKYAERAKGYLIAIGMNVEEK